MSYESALSEMYAARLAAKQRKEKSRQSFRESIINKQNHAASLNSNRTYRHNAEVTQDVLDDFKMPETLPCEEAKLKWLIFQNLELMRKCPGRVIEAKANIKKIKDFNSEQKKRPGLPAQGGDAS